MRLISARQVWFDIFYISSGDLTAPKIQRSPVLRYPEYRAGAKAAIDSLPRHLWYWGHLCFNPLIESSPRDYEIYARWVKIHIVGRGIVTFKSKRKFGWLLRMRALAPYAIEEVRYHNPVDMKDNVRPHKYTKADLERAVFGSDNRNFDRDCREQWEWLTETLDGWVGEALGPLSQWMESQDEVA